MSLKKNYMYNSIKILNELLYPIITIPYVSRIIGAQGIGIIEYVNAICIYGIVFSNFGVDKSGGIKIAQIRENQELKEQIIYKYLNFQIITTLIGLITYLILGRIFGINKVILLIFGIKIIFNFFKVEWYYNGIEDFKYITIRDFITKLICIICILYFVKNSNDINKYAFILVLGESLSNICNLAKIYKKEKINIKKILFFSKNNIKELYLENRSFCMAGFSLTIYLILDKIMLGLIKGDIYVGYYSMANRIVRISLSFSLPIISVLIPKLAQAYYKKNVLEFKNYIEMSIKNIYLLTIPMFVGLNIMAKSIIILVLGDKFLNAILTLRILSFILLIVPLANIFGLQILNIIGKSSKYTVSIFIAGIVNFILNLIMIQIWAQNGAAIASIVAEFIGVVFQYIFLKKNIILELKVSKDIMKYIFASIIMGIVIYCITLLNYDFIIKNILAIIIGINVYFICVYLQKDTLLYFFIKKKGKFKT